MSTIESKFEQNPPLKTEKIFLGFQICVRILATASTLVATWMVLTSKQSTEIIGMKFDARYSYSPAYKFFAVANAIACVFSVLSLFLVFLLKRQCSNPANYFFLFLHDLFMALLVLAGCAAATAIGYVGKHGNDHSGWQPICDHFGKFCKRITNSVILSYLAVFFLLMLTISSASKSRQIQV
ncbi:CASP-like protein 1F1 [Ziziphus jujuba]|uniref:CASP-like protein n=2 Tax=Ziziphus jujuba TaxID=326968 RepID=A0A6P3ZNQ8_ZIZJJ|nr:CASP-like protein 1F1 [Ziziphus jujuba]KAH7528172.1 hypothetical protein FEM48_Zijuj05G0044000 [Ziziphus jujuba var. spinosa]